VNIQILNDAMVSYMTTHPWIILLLIWSIIWKLIALWKAAKNNHLTIFIVLAVLNTAGIAEIIYIGYLYFKGKKKEIKK
jgi:multidrug transporter EmrE-like cation transporter